MKTTAAARDGYIRLKTDFANVARCQTIRLAVGGEWDANEKEWVYTECPMTWDLLRQHFGIETPADKLVTLSEMPHKDFVPWQHQTDAYNFAVGLPAALLAHEMGTGKTFTAVGLLNAWGAQRVLIVCPLSVVPVWRRQFAMHSPTAYNVLTLDNGGTVAKRMMAAKAALDIDVPTAIVINYEAVWREPFGSWALQQKWSAVVFDECVEEGTMISTPMGDRPIESVEPYDSVWGFDDETGKVVSARVIRQMRRITTEEKYLIGNTTMTGNHPVWTPKGYKPASTLCGLDIVRYLAGGKDVQTCLRMVQEGVRSGEAAQQWQAQEILRNKLFGKVADVKARLCKNAGHSKSKTEVARGPAKDVGNAGVPSQAEGVSAFRSQSLSQPGDGRRAAPQGGAHSARKGILQGARGKWKAAADSAAATGGETGVVDGIRSEHPEQTRERNPVVLQSRHSGPDLEDCCGSGRAVSSCIEAERTGLEEGCFSNRPGLEDDPRNQQGGDAEPRSRGAENPVGRAVYNLETSTGNYFANGLLVHNCHRLKAPGGKASRFAAKLRERATRRLGLSGTPLAHSPLDAYAVMRALDVRIFGVSFTRFKAIHAVMGGFNGYEFIRLRDPDRFSRMLGSIMHRVEKRDVLDLPPVIHEQRYCTLSGECARVYREMEQDFVTWLKNGVQVTASNALVKLLRLAQVTGGHIGDENGETHEIGRDKIKTFEEFLEDFPVGEPLVVFCRFVADVSMVVEACENNDRTVAQLTGAMKELDRWQNGDAEVLVAQIQVGSEGIDLTRAATCVFYSVGYSLATYTQALARLDRPGQTRSVTYVHLIANDTVDEKVMIALEKRQEVVDSILRGGWHGDSKAVVE